MVCIPPGSSVHRILQARILEWVAISLSRASSGPRDQASISCIDRWILYHLSHQGSPKNKEYRKLKVDKQGGALTALSPGSGCASQRLLGPHPF